jgi:hypothetical protein
MGAGLGRSLDQPAAGLTRWCGAIAIQEIGLRRVREERRDCERQSGDSPARDAAL